MGIKFRNKTHKTWFLLSSTLMMSAFIAHFWFIYLGGNGISAVFPMGVMTHMLISGWAFNNQIVVKKQKDRVFSKDCIWYNTLMAGIYLTAYFTL